MSPYLQSDRVVLQKLLSSERAMRSLRNSFILAPTLALTVGFVGISLVLITEYSPPYCIISFGLKLSVTLSPI